MHAHLRHRPLPDQDALKPAHWTLRLWAATLIVAALALLLSNLTGYLRRR